METEYKFLETSTPDERKALYAGGWRAWGRLQCDELDIFMLERPGAYCLEATAST